MRTQTTNERSLSQIRLDNSGKPVYIYFSKNNTRAEEITLTDDFRSVFFYDYEEQYLPIHSEDSPAIYYEDGSTAWLIAGAYHRWNGPAIEDQHHLQCQYWLNGIYLTESEYQECLDYQIEPHPTENYIIYTKVEDPGCIHRELGPAIEYSDGSNLWVKDGQLVDKSRSSHHWPVTIGSTLALAAFALVGLNKRVISNDTKQSQSRNNRASSVSVPARKPHH